MANSQTNGPRSAYATIDTAPGASGYWCASVSMSNHKIDKMFWSRRGGGTATVTIQFKCPGDSDWTDFTTSEDLADGERFRLDDEAAGVKWRTGVKNGDYTSGDIIVGFDW